MTGLNGPSGDKRHKRSVWTIATSPFPGAHFATYPPALVEPCILAGTSEKRRTFGAIRYCIGGYGQASRYDGA
jgi:hypothetical protein